MSAPPQPRGFRMLAMIAGFLVWTSCFLVLYIGQSLGCRAGLQRSGILGVDALTLLLSALWLVHAAAILWMLWRAVHRYPRFAGTGLRRHLRATTIMLHAGALAATLWIGLPILLLPSCA